MKTSMVFNLTFTNNDNLSCLFFLTIHLCFLIPTVIAQILILQQNSQRLYQLLPTKVIPTKEEKAEIKTHSVTAKAKIKKCKYKLNAADMNCKQHLKIKIKHK